MYLELWNYLKIFVSLYCGYEFTSMNCISSLQCYLLVLPCAYFGDSYLQ